MGIYGDNFMVYNRLRNSAIKGAKLTAFSTTLSGVLMIIQLIIVGRKVGPDAFGLFTMVNLVVYQ